MYRNILGEHTDKTRRIIGIAVIPCITFLIYIPAIMGAAFILGLSGCSSISSYWPAREWSDAFVYNSDHYTVNTNTSPETAAHIAELMERSLSEYIKLTGYRDEYWPVFRINAYALKNDYDALAGRNGFPQGLTTGFYTPEPPAAIHLPYIRKRGRYPDKTLLHEGMHQFLDRLMSFSIPPDAADILPPSKQSLLGVPFWLNEGLAAYMEGSYINDDSIEVGHVNRGRLIYLQRLIRTGRIRPIREVLSKRYGEPFTASDYAVAWGIVYAIQNRLYRTSEKTDEPTLLMEYLEACKRAFYEDPAVEFPRDFLSDGKPIDDFDKQWAVYIAKQSPLFFERIMVRHATNIEAWEKDWIRSIRRLTP